MTTIQVSILEKIQELLGEHFDSWVLVTMHKKDDGTNCMDANYGGGYYTAHGLLHSAIVCMNQEKSDESSDVP